MYDSYDAMLKHPGLEAVWISSSTNVHAEQTLKAIESGMHVLCEKPLSTDIEEVRKEKSYVVATVYRRETYATISDTNRPRT